MAEDYITKRLREMGLLKAFEERNAKKKGIPAPLSPPAPDLTTAPAVFGLNVPTTGPPSILGTGSPQFPTTVPQGAPPAPPVPEVGTTTAGVKYKIVPGDTLSALARKHGTTVDALMAANPSIKDPNLIYAGATLNIPGTAPVAPIVAPPTVTPPIGAPPTVAPTAPTAPPTAPPAPPIDYTTGLPPTVTPTTPTDIYTGIQTAVTDYQKAVQDQITTLSTSYDNLAQVIRDRPSLLEQYKLMADEAGVPEMKSELARLQGRATQLEEQLETLPADVKNRVKNFLVSQTQYERITAAEAEPLTKLYNALARAYEAKGRELELTTGEITTTLGLWEKDMAREETALQWALEGAKSVADLQTKLAEKGIEFAALPMQIAESAAGLELTQAKTAQMMQEMAAPDILSVAEAKSLGVPYGTTRQQAMGITPGVGEGILSVSEAKALGVPYGTTKAEAIKMGLVPTGAEIITQATLNKLAVAGVPNNIALDIQGYYNNGYDNKTILGAMIDTFGKEKAIQYMKAYDEVTTQAGVIQIGMPTLKEAPDYEAMAEEVSPTTQPTTPKAKGLWETTGWGKLGRWWSGLWE